jgi:hypothetical protein
MSERLFQWRTTFGGDIDGTTSMVFAEPRGSTRRQDSVDTQTVLELSAKDFGLPLDTTECRSDLKVYAVVACRSAQSLPRRGGGGNKQVLSAILAMLRNNEVLSLFAHGEGASRDERDGNAQLLEH